MPRPHVDQDECISCESCVQICPAAFEMNDDGKAQELESATGGEECIQEAMDTCPAECIHWQD
ncbi:Ferredoxin-1 [Fundidesulfovibrio magnetotacticus]|uniref:Ferredoxin n=1 Tax=Fundidesulfovibrio magnetotacticus TaxID=2730080 RepID=A0A6V8LM71_9BACT|nr:ferredoxin [Fundidesulfovibrio magnetotacticus]GFK93772.1 Ferredoxin-1 [Fundidesulfovibrio magnetotacticus]